MRERLQVLARDRTERRIGIFWAIFHGLGYIVSSIAFLLWSDAGAAHRVSFLVIVLLLVTAAWLVITVATIAVIRLFREEPSPRDEA